VTAFAEQVASGALTSQFVSERRRLEGRIERLRTQHTEAVRYKSVAENKSQNLLERLSAVEKEREDLGRRLAEEKEDVEKARVEAQDARAEAQAARKRAADMELELKNIRAHREKTNSSPRAGVEWTHTLFVDAYRELSAQTAPFDESGEDVRLWFLGWSHEELESRPSIAMGRMY
jgi:DNA repair exonuclease SbcCD ATPase subunit